MSKKPAKKIEVAPIEAIVDAPKFVPCRQCGYPADCERASRCVKGFK